MNQLESAASILSLKAERFAGNARIVRCNGTIRTKTDRREYAEDLEEVAQFLAVAVQYIKDANNDIGATGGSNRGFLSTAQNPLPVHLL